MKKRLVLKKETVAMLDRKMSSVRGGADISRLCVDIPATEYLTCRLTCVPEGKETYDPKECVWIPATEYQSCRDCPVTM